MLLCFSKRSPVVGKSMHNHKVSRSWSPDTQEQHRAESRRWHCGEEYTRCGDEYRRHRSTDDSDNETGAGFRRNRNSEAVNESRDDIKRENADSRRSSYGTDVEDRNEITATKALVHRRKASLHAESFRSSMLWKDLDVEKLPKGNLVLPTFPPNRYSIVPEMPAKICPTPLTAKRKPRFRVNLDVSRYSPNEVNVQIEEGFLITEGKHFAESDFGYETCEFYRKYPLPEGLESNNISYKINSDGILIVAGGAENESHSVKEKHNTLNDETRTANAVRNKKRSSAYDNITSENCATEANQRSGATKQKQSIGFEDFKFVNNQRYVLVVDANGYDPEDMKVRVVGNELIVTGSKKVENKEGNERRIVHKEFTKKYDIPKSADIDSIASRMTSDGHLKIECGKCD